MFLVKHLLNRILSLALLPILIYQGKSIRKKVPRLPEAKNPEGVTNSHFTDELYLVTLGESTIAGVGVDFHKNGFTGTLAQKLSSHLQKKVHWKVIAKSGYTAKKVTNRLVEKIEGHPDIIVIGLGGNDAFTLNRVSKWASDIDILIRVLQSKFPNTILIFTNMPPIKEFPAFTNVVKWTIGRLVEFHGEALTQVVKKYNNVYYMDEVLQLALWVDKLDGKYKVDDFFSDGVHPSALTYQLWAGEVATFIKDLPFGE